VTLARRSAGARWTFAAPAVGYAADGAAVDEWLAALQAVQLDLAPAAPGAPARTLRIISPGLDEKTTVFGPGAKPKAGGGEVAVLRAGEAVAARAPATLLALLDPDPLRFRDRKVLDLARFDAQSLRVRTGGRTVDVAKSEDQSWHATAPAAAELDAAALDRLLGTLTNLRAERYLPPATRVPVQRTLTLTERPPGAAASVTHVLELSGRRPDGCQGRLADAAFTLAPAACDALLGSIAR